MILVCKSSIQLWKQVKAMKYERKKGNTLLLEFGETYLDLNTE